jgi:hypothetical protein
MTPRGPLPRGRAATLEPKRQRRNPVPLVPVWGPAITKHTSNNMEERKALNAVVTTITNMRLHRSKLKQQHNNIKFSTLFRRLPLHYLQFLIFLPAISKGPLYATMNVFGFGSVSVQKKYFLGNVCLKNSGLITRQNDLLTKPEAYVLHN